MNEITKNDDKHVITKIRNIASPNEGFQTHRPFSRSLAVFLRALVSRTAMYEPSILLPGHEHV